MLYRWAAKSKSVGVTCLAILVGVKPSPRHFAFAMRRVSVPATHLWVLIPRRRPLRFFIIAIMSDSDSFNIYWKTVTVVTALSVAFIATIETLRIIYDESDLE